MKQGPCSTKLVKSSNGYSGAGAGWSFAIFARTQGRNTHQAKE